MRYRSVLSLDYLSDGGLSPRMIDSSVTTCEYIFLCVSGNLMQRMWNKLGRHGALRSLPVLSGHAFDECSFPCFFFLFFLILLIRFRTDALNTILRTKGSAV